MYPEKAHLCVLKLRTHGPWFVLLLIRVVYARVRVRAPSQSQEQSRIEYTMPSVLCCSLFVVVMVLPCAPCYS
jgi:hypothetical protein